MQKKIIALAVAALASTAAFAQTNVTIYGIADVGVLGTTQLGNTAAQTQFGINSGVLSTSRIGFKGVEDLGNGLKALFTLEYALNIDDNSTIGGSGATKARQQFVGLTGGFGTVVAGRLQTTGLDFTVAGSALGGSTGLGATNVVGGGTLISAGARANNAIAYISPSFGGLTLAYNHARAPLDTTEYAAVGVQNTDNTANLVSVNYDNGPISAGAVYTKYVQSQTNLIDDNTKEWGLRAGYDFKVVKLQATYQQQKADLTSAVGKDSKWVVSVSAPIGAKVGVIAEFAHLSKKSTAHDDNANAFTLASTYALSKRTTAYAGFVAKRTQNNVATPAVAYVGDTNTYGLGLRHMF